MAKTLVYKALSLLEDDVDQDKPLKKKNVDSSVKQNKRKQSLPKKRVVLSQDSSKDILKNSASIDRTEENLKILMQLRALKPKTSVAQKVLELYAKPTNSVEEPEEKAKKQKSILFDDDDDNDDDDEKDKKKRKKRKYDVDSW